jgi:ribosomal protein L37E
VKTQFICVKDLHDQTGHDGPRSILYCSVCGAEESANRGDYWNIDPDHIFSCCGFPMSRVVRSTVFSHVGKEHI